jgi:hypothetical protein
MHSQPEQPCASTVTNSHTIACHSSSSGNACPAIPNSPVVSRTCVSVCLLTEQAYTFVVGCGGTLPRLGCLLASVCPRHVAFPG